MTDDIADYERVRTDQTLWTCPDCGEPLDPLGDPDRDERRTEVDWWDEPEKWADEPAVVCSDCGQRYRLQFEPVE